MKKKLLSSLLAVFMVVTALTTDLFADNSMVDDVIDTSYFPIAERTGDVAWKNDNGATVYWYTAENPGLGFRLESNNVYLRYDVSLTPSSDNYVCTVEGITYTFYMANNKLICINLAGSLISGLNGDYYPLTTIADVLPDDFSTSTWINGIGTEAYADVDDLIFEDVDSNILDSVPLNTELKYYNGGYYRYTNGTKTYEIGVVDNKAMEFTLSGEGFNGIPEIKGRYEKHKSGTTVLDILLTNSNFHSYNAVPWSNANGKVINIVSDDENTFFGFAEFLLGVDTTDVPSQVGDNFIIMHDSVNITFEFVMNDGVLTSVIVDGLEELEPSMAVYDGEYNAPITISSLITTVDDFPVTKESGWIKENNSSSNRIYIDGENLKIGASSFPLNGVVTKEGDNYKYTSGMVIVNFIMESNVLKKINFIVMSATASGDYIPYKYEIEPTESKPQGYAGNLVFKTNGQYTNDFDVVVKVDGTPLTLNTDYMVEKGSIKVTLLGDYIKNLAPKTYTISIGSPEDSYAEIASQFTIFAIPSPNPKPEYNPPKTGVESVYSNNHSLLKLSSLSLLAIGSYIVIKKKKENK